MANIKSQLKRNRQNEKRRVQNRVYRGSARRAVVKARQSLTSDSVETARTMTMEAISQLDHAAQKGVLHKNNASRRKGRLMKALAALEKAKA
ncbi:MAG: 30S ribosomal protein S20 [Anaerolineales bacterium]|nr:30S ribosomal protein S20 [Anaerolineales bacterium]